MFSGIHHTGLSVRDLDAAIDYYCTAQAFETVARYRHPNMALAGSASDNQVALLKGPTGFLELMHFAANKDATPKPFEVYEEGIRHVCLQDRDVDPFFDSHIDAGASWHARPSGLGTGALYAYIRDPEGNVLELEGVPWSSSVGVRPWYAHTALVTPDIARLSAFYERLTGIACHRRGSFGPNAKFDTVAGLKDIEFKGAWIQLPVGVVEMWEYTTPKTQVAPRGSIADLGWNHLSFEVEDLDAASAHLRDIGATEDLSQSESEIANSLYTRDPDGNVIELFQPKPEHLDLSVGRLDGLAFLQQLKRDLAVFQQGGVKA